MEKQLSILQGIFLSLVNHEVLSMGDLGSPEFQEASSVFNYDHRNNSRLHFLNWKVLLQPEDSKFSFLLEAWHFK